MTKKKGQERREVLYEGRVQGVGFRFRTQAVAARYVVSGFVKNLPDGRVQLVIEGEPSELDKMIVDIAAEMRGNIQDSKIISREPSGEFTQFSIRH